MNSLKPNAIYIADNWAFNKVYGAAEQADITARLNVLAPCFNAKSVLEHPAILRETEVILSSWGMTMMDEAFLAAAPRLKAVFYAAGSVKGFVSDAFWARNILLSSAWGANAVPVCEFTLAAILFSLKHTFRLNRAYCGQAACSKDRAVPGAYGTKVGLVSLGMIGRLVRDRLRPFDVEVLAYDPFLKPGEAAQLGVKLVPLDVLFRECDVVSLHTPWLKETEGLITGALFASMKPGASFVNTARGAIVCESEMIEVLMQRPDLFAVLDVTYPEPPVADSPLYTMPNVFLTPHIAGSMENECRRMGRYMIEELDLFLAGQSLKWQITKAKADLLA
jgi:phosphoglycerate dehydrogenase-like enzyme